MTRIQIRRDTSSNWATYNPILADGEFALETDTRKLKIGNGEQPYNDLAYQEGETYILPPATANTLGGIKVGENLSITEDGILSADTYNKSTLDTKFEEKQDILTATNGISIERKTISNVEGFSYTSDASAIYNTGGWGVLTPSGQNWDVSRVPGINALIGTSMTATTFPNRIVMPYTFGQIVKFPTWGNINTVINGAISFGKLAEDGTFYPIWFPERTRYYYTADDNIIQKSGNFTQIHFNSYTDWGQSPTNSKFGVFTYNTAYGYMQLKVTDSDLKLNYTNGSSNRSYMNQYYKTNTAILNRFREVNAVMFVPYFDVLGNIKIGVDQGSAIPVTSIGLYANTMDLYDSAEQLDSYDFGENLFDIGGVQAHNYISINTDNSTIKVNDSGQLYADVSLPDNITTQGNTFNGANQLVKIDGNGNISIPNNVTAIQRLRSNVITDLNNNTIAKSLSNGETIQVGWNTSFNVNLIGKVLVNNNEVNSANGLVQLDNSGKLPAIDGSQLTNLPAATAPTNMVTTDTEQTITGSKTFDRSIYFSENINLSSKSSNFDINLGDSLFPANYCDITIKDGGLKLIDNNNPGNTLSFQTRNTYWRVGGELRRYVDGTDYPIYDASNIPTGALKYWTGIETDYTAISAKDPDTLYRTTDTNKVFLGTIQLGG